MAGTRQLLARGVILDRLCVCAMVAIIGLGLFVPEKGACSQTQSGTRRPVSIEDQISMRRPRDVQISPDGKWVAYVLSTPDIERNQYTHDIYVVPADGTSVPRRLTHNEPREGFGSSFPGPRPVWNRESSHLLYVAIADEAPEIRSLDVKTGRETTLLAERELGEGRSFFTESADYTDVQKVWIEPSPDGSRLAFLVRERKAVAQREKIYHAIEINSPDWRAEEKPLEVARLWVMDLNTRNARPITDATMTVSWFDWSPDGRRFAVEASTRLQSLSYFMANDIYVIDADGTNLRPLVVMEGWDRQPRWSPDGKSILFATQQGQEYWMYAATLAIVDANGGSPRVIGNELDRIAGSRPGGLWWIKGGRSVLASYGHHLSYQLFELSTNGGTPRKVTPREDRSYSNFSFSQDASKMAFVAEGVGVPPDLYVSSTKRFAPRRLTVLNPDWASLSVPSTQIVQWPSRDGRWTIHGLLIKPSTFAQGQRYPLLVNNYGGPAMVTQRTNPVDNYPLLALAEMGYAILLPNTRGRGGYGAEFQAAIRDERSYSIHQVQDVLAGTEAMIDRGIADPKQVGTMGFSYGEILTLNSIIESDRFKAAIVGGGIPDLLLLLQDASTSGWSLYRDMYGLPNGFDRDNIERAFKQTSIFFLDRVCTPVLIESGEHDGYERHQALFRGLRHFGVPVEHNFYPRSGHGYEEPKLLQDSYRRQVAWFDYWLRGKPYRDAARQVQYDAWKSAAACRG
jgi:dipeptidyl aminopeptidase/acylaminoacyl peptidase